MERRVFCSLNKKNDASNLTTLQNKPTGFEEYYVDAPITPEQYKEEREVYDPYVYTYALHPFHMVDGPTDMT